LMFMGVPLLLAVIADNQRANARALRASISSLVLNQASARVGWMISEALRGLLGDKELRGNMSRAASAVVDGLGASRVLEPAVRNHAAWFQ